MTIEKLFGKISFGFLAAFCGLALSLTPGALAQEMEDLPSTDSPAAAEQTLGEGPQTPAEVVEAPAIVDETLLIEESTPAEVAPTEASPVDHSITLTKVVEVYEYEDVKVTVDQYQIQRGDGLFKLLRQRGLLRNQADEARMLRLVRNLNPGLGDPNQLEVGQTLNLPTLATGDAAAEGATSISLFEASVAPRGSSGELADFPSGNVGPLALDQVSQVVYRTVEVRPGDTLEKILLREGMDRDFIYSHLLRVTMKLNPELADPNVIFAGVELRIPAAGDYLTALGGIDPATVRSAAAAMAQGRPVAIEPQRQARRNEEADQAEPARRAPAQPAVLALPDAATEAAKNSLGLIFTRLGTSFSNRGYLSLPAGNTMLEIDTGLFPMIELPEGRRILLDLGSRFPKATVDALRRYHPEYQVFRTARNETLDRAMDRLLAMCDFYRVYKKERAYEGGGDIRLKIAADWIIWPTAEAWNYGQPLVINKVGPDGQRTDAVWSAFLETHGFKMMDLQQNLVLPAQETTLSQTQLKSIILDRSNEALMASQLVSLMGFEPQLDKLVENLGLDDNGQPWLVPLVWETDSAKIAMDFGDLPEPVLEKLASEGYRVIKSGASTDAVIGTTLAALGVKPSDGLSVDAPAGGPAMSLTIRGLYFSSADQHFLITQSPLAPGLANLVPERLLVVKKEPCK